METAYAQKLNIRELEKANMVISQFITSCSHAMRGPLKSIEGLVNLLYKRRDYSEIDETAFLDLIGETTFKMENMLDELEQLLENSKREVTLKKIDCREIVDAVLARYREEIIAGKVKVDTTIEEAVEFFSDGPRLYLVLSHLLENAIQFQDKSKDEHRIHVTMQTTRQHGTVLISDNGIGVNPEEQGKIFQLFYRATEKSTGAGVGLYVAREAVEKMGGSIYVESLPGRGSIFGVTLPNLAA